MSILLPVGLESTSGLRERAGWLDFCKVGVGGGPGTGEGLRPPGACALGRRGRGLDSGSLGLLTIWAIPGRRGDRRAECEVSEGKGPSHSSPAPLPEAAPGRPGLVLSFAGLVRLSQQLPKNSYLAPRHLTLPSPCYKRPGGFQALESVHQREELRRDIKK